MSEPDETSEGPRINGGGTPVGGGLAGTMRSNVFAAGSQQELMREAQALRRVEGLVRRGHRELDLAKLEKAGRFVVDTETHELWIFSEGEPPRGRPLEHAFGLTDSHQIRWYRPANTTIGEVLAADERAERDAQERERAERKRLRDLAKKATHVVSWNDLDRSAPATLREAQEVIERQAAGRLDVEGDRLRIVVSSFGDSPYGDPVRTAARMLYAAEDEVVACIRGKRELPSAPVTPAGAVIG